MGEQTDPEARRIVSTPDAADIANVKESTIRSWAPFPKSRASIARTASAATA